MKKSSKDSKPSYDRLQLRQIGTQLIQYLGYSVEDEDRPFRVKKSQSDEEVLDGLKKACTKAVSNDFEDKEGEEKGAGDLPDELLQFLVAEGILKEEEDEDEDADEEESDDEDSDDDEDEDADEEDSDEDDDEDGDDDDELEKLNAELDADAEEPKKQKGKGKASASRDVSRSGDPKVKDLAVEQPVYDAKKFAQSAPVTAANAEAAVQSICNMLGAGKVVIITAMSIEDAKSFALGTTSVVADDEPEPVKQTKRSKKAEPEETEDEEESEDASEESDEEEEAPKKERIKKEPAAKEEKLPKACVKAIGLAAEEASKKIRAKLAGMRDHGKRASFIRDGGIEYDKYVRSVYKGRKLSELGNKLLGNVIEAWYVEKASALAKKRWMKENSK